VYSNTKPMSMNKGEALNKTMDLKGAKNAMPTIQLNSAHYHYNANPQI